MHTLLLEAAAIILLLGYSAVDHWACSIHCTEQLLQPVSRKC